MGVVARASQIILLVEDPMHERLVFGYLKRLGYRAHAVRIRRSPSGAGSAEQWVREHFAIEREYCRRRHAETKLIVVIDADTQAVQQRLAQLVIPNDTRGIARLVPKRNIETWILCLNDVQVNEDADYKRTRDNWAELVPTAVSRLYQWTRANAIVAPSCIESLRMGIRELQRVGL
jgi:hypothetical protein